jgi:hypothetical protein
MDNRDEETVRRSAETLAATSALIAAEMAAAGPDVYISDERGPTRVSSMSPVWAKRAERAVEEGRRPANDHRVVKALDRRAKEG